MPPLSQMILEGTELPKLVLVKGEAVLSVPVGIIAHIHVPENEKVKMLCCLW